MDALNEGLGRSLHQGEGNEDTKDGMDIALCAYNDDTKELQYAGGFNPLYLVRNGELEITKADKFPVGSFIHDEPSKFTNHKVQLQKGDMIYINSDGFQDQFGGPKGKKYMLGKLKKLFVEISDKPLEDQYAILEKELTSWMGDNEQVDDILIIGLKVSS